MFEILKTSSSDSIQCEILHILETLSFTSYETLSEFQDVLEFCEVSLFHANNELVLRSAQLLCNVFIRVGRKEFKTSTQFANIYRLTNDLCLVLSTRLLQTPVILYKQPRNSDYIHAIFNQK